jgi:2'-5' RNA ligase
MVKSKFDFICEGAGNLGCLLVRFPLSSTVEIQEWIIENIPSDVVITPEHESHVTLYYGIKPEADFEAIKKWLSSTPKIVIKLKSIGLFKNPDKDVVKIEVESPQLHQLNQELESVVGAENLQPSMYDYNPHVTLAYVVNSTCDHLSGHDRFNGYVYVLDTVTYSQPGSKRKIDIELKN